MPTYQYACTECGHDFEAVQSFSDDSLTECPVCAGRLRKVFNAVGIVFKGSGFYRTDSRHGASKDGAKDGSKDKAEKTSGTDKAATTGKDAGSGTSTPAAKPGSSSGTGSSGSGSGSSTATTTASKAGSAA